MQWIFQREAFTQTGGRPKVDVAAEIARTLVENDGEAIYAAFQKVLRQGSPYAFQVLSDRAFGKLKETHAIEHNPYKNLSDEELEPKIKEIEEKLTKRYGYIKADSRNCFRLRTMIRRFSGPTVDPH